MRARMSDSFKNLRVRNDFNMKTLRNSWCSTHRQTLIARALADSQDNQYISIFLFQEATRAVRARMSNVSVARIPSK